MFRYLLVLMLLLVILPVNAFDVTTCPICPAPQFVYVTVTPLPTPTPAPQVVYINAPADPTTAPQQGYLITDTQLTVLKYGAVAIVIVLILAGAAIFIVKRRRKNKGKKPQKLIITKNIDELYEETVDPEPEPEPEPEPKPEKKIFKRPKKVKSLLDQDFEF